MGCFVSVCWSFKTGVMSFLKIHSEQKAGMLSGAAKVVLGLRALLFSATRIGCVVAFFGPFLGLGDCMAHWHAEVIELDPELLDNLRKNINSSGSYWDNETVSLMYREQDYTNYTLVTLQSAFFIFLGVILFHGIAIFALKMAVSSHFKSTSWLNKIGHVVESLHLPHAFKDFDLVEEGSPEDYRLAYNSVLKETLWMTSLQAVSNLLLLVPLLVTASKVRERHSVLVVNIGTFAEEDKAHDLLNSLSMSLPIVVMVIWVLDALLAAVYLKWLHPWKILLQEEPEQWGLEMFNEEEGMKQFKEADAEIEEIVKDSKEVETQVSKWPSADIVNHDLSFSKWRTAKQGMLALLPMLMDKRIPLSWYVLDTGWRWTYTATLDPTRWMLRLSWPGRTRRIGT